MKRIAMAAGLLAVGACTDPQRTSDEAFARLRGQPIQNVSARLGPPEQAIKVDGGTIYTWSSSGVHGSASAFYTVSCRVEVHANFQGRVQAVRYNGSNGACQEMLERLL